MSFVTIAYNVQADGNTNNVNTGQSRCYTIGCVTQGATIEYEGTFNGINYFPLTSALSPVSTGSDMEVWRLVDTPVVGMRLNVSNYDSGVITAWAVLG